MTWVGLNKIRLSAGMHARDNRRLRLGLRVIGIRWRHRHVHAWNAAAVVVALLAMRWHLLLTIGRHLVLRLHLLLWVMRMVRIRLLLWMLLLRRR